MSHVEFCKAHGAYMVGGHIIHLENGKHQQVGYLDANGCMILNDHGKVLEKRATPKSKKSKPTPLDLGDVDELMAGLD
jgi:hypothetical protein